MLFQLVLAKFFKSEQFSYLPKYPITNLQLVTANSSVIDNWSLLTSHCLKYLSEILRFNDLFSVKMNVRSSDFQKRFSI